MQISRREFFLASAGVCVALSLPWSSEASDDIGFSTKLEIADIRELIYADITSGAYLAKYDVAFTVNRNSKIRQIGVDCQVLPSADDVLRMRSMALEMLQREFTKARRVRRNLYPLRLPAGWINLWSWIPPK